MKKFCENCSHFESKKALCKRPNSAYESPITGKPVYWAAVVERSEFWPMYYVTRSCGTAARFYSPREPF